MKKILLMIVASLLVVGLAGCDMFGPDDIPEVCDEGFHLEGTECVPDEVVGDIPVITLVGNSTVTIAAGTTYTDEGATATDTEDGNLTSAIVVVDSVNENTPGTYTVTYDVTDSDGNAAVQVVRTVIVQAVNDTIPVITLTGNATITINTGDTFTDPGATATDAEDGNLTSSIVVTGSVDAMTSGTYTLSYNVTDSDGNAAVTVTRTVIVLPSDAEVLANYIVDNWDGTLSFLGAVVVNMDFSQAMNMSVTVDFEVTEDIDEVHMVHAVITDQYLYAETGNTMHRTIDLDVEGTQVSLEFMFQEVANGVHVYVRYRPLFDMIQAQDPEMIEMLGWFGFDDEWALFQIDDTLQNVVEVAIVKDMITSLFFSEMGELFFYQLQDQLETEIGFDLNQYGVDLGQFIDYLIEEDFTNAELLLQNVQVEHIVLHVDYMYVAWHLYEFFIQYETELSNAGFDTTKLGALNTAYYDDVAGEIVVTATLPIDPLEMNGTQAFFDSLTEAEMDTLADLVIKPTLEQMAHQLLIGNVNPEWLQGDLESMLTDYEQFLIDNWPANSDPFVLANELADIQSMGPVEYWKDLTQEEMDVIRWAIDHHFVGWSVNQLNDLYDQKDQFQPGIQRYGVEIDYYAMDQRVKDLISLNHDYVMTNYSIDTDNWIATIEDQGIIWWFHELNQTEKDIVFELRNMTGNEEYHSAVDELSWLSERPWDYQWWYTNGETQIGVDYATSTVQTLLENHQTYLMNTHGIDTTLLIEEIWSYEHGVIEWMTYHATEDEIIALFDVADFEMDEHFEWTLEQLEDIRDYDWEYWVYFGNPQELYDIEWMNAELEQLLFMNEVYLNDTYSIDAYAWANQLRDMGAIQWWNSLSQNEKDILDEISLLNDGWYRWPVEVLIMIDEESGMFVEVICHREHWGYCINDEEVTNDLVQLINNNTGYFEDQGYVVADLIAEIEMYGAIDWYLHYTNEFDRDSLEEVSGWAEWRYEVLWTLEDIVWTEMDLVDFMTNHQTTLDNLGFPTAQRISELQMYGIQVWASDYLTTADIELLMDAYVHPKLFGLYDAIQAGEVPEFIVATFFGDVHITAVLASLTETPEFDPLDVFDNSIIASNMMAIDFDALVLETVDLEAMLLAIYDGQTAYDAYVADLADSSSLNYAPNTAKILEVFSPGIGTLTPFTAEVQYALDNLSLFEHYLDPSYWTTETNMDIATPEVTSEYYIETTMTMDPIMYQTVAQDLFDDINAYLLGFQLIPFPYDENWECINVNDPYCEDLEINNLMAALTQFGDITMSSTFDPSDPSWMQMDIDLTAFLNVLVEESNAWMLEDPNYVPNEYNDILTGVNNATISVTMSEGGTITLPVAADIDNVNNIAYETGKFGVSMVARDYLRELYWYYDMNQSELQDLLTAGDATYALGDFEFIRLSNAFDHDMSTIAIVVDEINGTFEASLTLYWIDGTEALNGAVSMSDFDALFTIDNELVDAAALTTMKGFVNDTNYHMAKLWLIFVLNEDDYQNDKY